MCMDVSDRIVSMLFIKKTFLRQEITLLLQVSLKRD